MRLDSRKVDFIKAGIQSIEDAAELYLFGSRVDDTSKGGDIDILILSGELLDKSQIRIFRREFFKKFGWQKLDLVNFRFSDQSAFKDIIIKDAIRL